MSRTIFSMKYSPWKLLAKTLGLLTALGFTGFYAFSSRPDLRLVAHIAEPDAAAVENALDSIESFVAAASADDQRSDVAVVVTGAGVKAFRRAKPGVLRAVERLQGAGVRFAVGEDTLQRMKVPDQDLPVGFVVVPSASYEIAKLRKRRYDYFRP